MVGYNSPNFKIGDRRGEKTKEQEKKGNSVQKKFMSSI